MSPSPGQRSRDDGWAGRCVPCGSPGACQLHPHSQGPGRGGDWSDDKRTWQCGHTGDLHQLLSWDQGSPARNGHRQASHPRPVGTLQTPPCTPLLTTSYRPTRTFPLGAPNLSSTSPQQSCRPHLFTHSSQSPGQLSGFPCTTSLVLEESSSRLLFRTGRRRCGIRWLLGTAAGGSHVSCVSSEENLLQLRL